MKKRRKAAPLRSVDFDVDLRKMREAITHLSSSFETLAAKLQLQAELTEEQFEDHEERLRALETRR